MEGKYYIQLIYCQAALQYLDNWNKPEKHSVHDTGQQKGKESLPQVNFSLSSDLCWNEICNVNVNRFLWGNLMLLQWDHKITSIVHHLQVSFNYCRSAFFCSSASLSTRWISTLYSETHVLIIQASSSRDPLSWEIYSNLFEARRYFLFPNTSCSDSWYFLLNPSSKCYPEK